LLIINFWIDGAKITNINMQNQTTYVENRISESAAKYKVPIFRKTSCLMSYKKIWKKKQNNSIFVQAGMNIF